MERQIFVNIFRKLDLGPALYLGILLSIGAAISFGVTKWARASDTFEPKTEVVVDDLPDNGVLTIRAGEAGYYTIDTRFDLCFLVSRSTVQVDCKVFENMHGND